MPARSNALSELTRFWLESRHGCSIRESIPVPVPYALSDIDLLAVRPDARKFKLPSGDDLAPRVIVETKDEHDFDANGKDFGKRLASDVALMAGGRFIPAKTKGVGFVMLREEHFQVAAAVFGTDDFDRLFVVHAMDRETLEKHEQMLRQQRVYWITAKELLRDLLEWYPSVERPAGLRNCLVGDLFHLLFGYCGAKL